MIRIFKKLNLLILLFTAFATLLFAAGEYIAVNRTGIGRYTAHGSLIEQIMTIDLDNGSITLNQATTFDEALTFTGGLTLSDITAFETTVTYQEAVTYLDDVTIEDTGLLYAKGELKVDGDAELTSTTEASAVGTAALTITGGLGVAKKAYIGTELNMATGTTGTQSIVLRDSVADALSILRGTTDMVVFDSATPKITITPATDITGAVALGNTLGVTGVTTFSDTTEASAIGTASVKVTGGLGVAKKLYLGTELNMATGTTGTQSIVLRDSVADALSIIRGSTDVIVIDSATPKVTITPATDITGAVLLGNSLGVTGASTFTGGIIDTGEVTTADINGGTIDGTTIGASAAAAGTFTAIKGTGISIGTSGAEVEITSTPAVLNQVVNFPGMQATAAVDFNTVGAAAMTITIDGVVYEEADIADAENGVWTNGGSAADSAASLLAALNGDTRDTVPFTAYADETADGVILIWDAVGSAGNVAITSSNAAATTASSVGGENAGTKQIVKLTREITTNDLLAGVITIPISFVPTGFNINAVDNAGTPIYFTDTVTVAATPDRILITTDGGTNLADTNVVHLTAWE